MSLSLRCLSCLHSCPSGTAAASVAAAEITSERAASAKTGLSLTSWRLAEMKIAKLAIAVCSAAASSASCSFAAGTVGAVAWPHYLPAGSSEAITAFAWSFVHALPVLRLIGWPPGQPFFAAVAVQRASVAAAHWSCSD